MLELLDTMTAALHGMIGSPWLWLIVFAVAGLDALLPFMPSETTVVIVAVLVASDPTLLLVLIVVAAAGAMAGDLLAYTIGRHAGPRIITRLTRDERGRRRHDWARNLLSRHGPLLIVAGRYIAGVRSVTMLTAGILRYPRRRFLRADATGATIWAAFSALIGYIGGTAFKDDPIQGMLLAFAIGLVLAAAIEIARRIAARRQPTGIPALVPA